MLFSSLPFLYGFLPCVLLVYVLSPRRWRNGVLFLFSLLFYAWGEPRYVLLMLLSIGQGYLFGRLIERFRGDAQRARLCLIASAVLSLGLLGVFKYADFFLSSFHAVTGLPVPLLGLTLPIGISFYTFQVLSYVIDVYRGTVPAQRSLLKLATYVALFPQLIAGPIVRYADVEQELTTRRTTLEDAAVGARRFVLGLAKKVLLANTLFELVTAFGESTQPSVLFAWMYAAACSLQIYFDFSGYSDMAIGLGRIFGFHFPENFQYPFISGSITEFWRRWHRSLGSWFRDYVYIPLGGNRVSTARWIRNLFLVWGLTGLWHGAAWNFVLWGLCFAVLLTAEKLWYGAALQRTRVVKYVYTLPLLAASFVLFSADSLSNAAANLGALFGFGSLPLVSLESWYVLRSYAVVFLLAGIGSTPLPARCAERLRSSKVGAVWMGVLEPLVLAALLAVCTAYLVDGSFNPFLYFRF